MGRLRERWGSRGRRTAGPGPKPGRTAQYGLAVLVFVGIWGAPGPVRAQGTAASSEKAYLDRRLAVDRAGLRRAGLPVSCGVAVAPRGPDSCWQLLQGAEVLDAGFTVLGRHGDGRPGFLLIEFEDTARSGFVLREWLAGSEAPGSAAMPARRLDLSANPPRGLPRLRAVLTGGAGEQLAAELEPVDAWSRPGGARIDLLRGVLRDTPDTSLLCLEAFVTRWPFRPDLAQLELVLRNDFPDDAHGPVRFESAVLEVRGAEWPHAAAAWSAANGTAVRRGRDCTWIDLFPEAPTGGHWLGDFQGKAWRLLLGGRSLDRSTWLAASGWLERPTLLLSEPREVAATGWFGPILGLGWGAARPAAGGSEVALKRLHWTWEEGWNGARGDTKFSGSTGSARVAPHTEATLRFVQTGERAFFQWLLETAYSQALRCYPREFEADRHPAVWLWDGQPRARGGADLLGRDRPRELAPAWRPQREFTWLEQWHGWNGFDWEHLSIDLVRDLYLWTGSPWARREALAVGEALATYDCLEQGAPRGNSRAYGWLLLTLAKLDAISEDERWLAGATRLVQRAWSEPLEHSGHRWLTLMNPDARGLGPDLRFEYPWHLAVAVHGLAAFLERRPAVGEEDAEELLARLCDTLAGPCFDEGSKLFAYAVAPEDPEQFIVRGARGTLEWIPSALVLGWLRLGPERGATWLERARAHAAQLGHPISSVECGGTWTWWQPFAAARARGWEQPPR